MDAGVRYRGAPLSSTQNMQNIGLLGITMGAQEDPLDKNIFCSFMRLKRNVLLFIIYHGDSKSIVIAG